MYRKVSEWTQVLEEQVVSLRAGLGEKQVKQYRTLDDRLEEIVNGYNSTMSTIDYLNAVSICIYGYQYKQFLKVICSILR